MRNSLNNLALKKEFYENQKEFTARSLSEYYISPGTRAKFDLIKQILGKREFFRALDVGCSGNSVFHFLPKIDRKFFIDIAHKPLKQYRAYRSYSPIMGSITNLPFNENSFDLITALDVIEHIKDDSNAIKELIRILAPKGILLITVPHRKKYYSYQDQLIGHYRRYEIDEINHLLAPYSMNLLQIFGIYGQLMRVQMIQASNPLETENSINKIRKLYYNNYTFQKIWNRIVNIGAHVMKLDARFQPKSKIMNIGLVYQKLSL